MAIRFMVQTKICYLDPYIQDGPGVHRRSSPIGIEGFLLGVLEGKTGLPFCPALVER
jgi:hypothetical protein